MRVGDYVRLKNGKIDKILMMDDFHVYLTKIWFYKTDIFKASNNIYGLYEEEEIIEMIVNGEISEKEGKEIINTIKEEERKWTI